jgi:transaldolase
MPEGTLRAVAAHGRVPQDSIQGHYSESHEVFGRIRALGIDYDDVVRVLEDQAVATFNASWEHVGAELGKQLGAPAEPIVPPARKGT